MDDFKRLYYVVILIKNTDTYQQYQIYMSTWDLLLENVCSVEKKEINVEAETFSEKLTSDSRR